MITRFITCTLLIFSLSFSLSAAWAEPLEISGKINRFTDDSHKIYRIVDQDFLALPQTTIRTATNWTLVADFTGVKVTDLLELVGAYGTVLEFRTLDDFMVRIPVQEFSKYGVILARKMNGELLKLSNFGPYFVIYPRDLYEDELKTVIAESKFAWHVNRIIVK